MTRAALLAAALVIAPAAAVAGEAWPAAPAGVGSEPWVRAAASPAFAPDDAYVFSEPVTALRLDAAAAEIACSIDQDRLAADAEFEDPIAVSTGRVAAAFADFTTYGSDGETYASLALARAGVAPRVASAPAPSLAALALASR